MPSTAKGTVAVGFVDGGSGIFQTSPGLLRRRVLGPWGEGVKQYLAIRLGEGRRGRAAYRSLVRIVNAMPPDELMAGPGPKAQLYHLARAVVATERAMPGFVAPETLRFRHVRGRRGKALARLRERLTEGESEALELFYARELSREELAYALELPFEDAELLLDTAEAKARQLLGSLAPDPADPSATAYVDAFALQRSWAEGAMPALEDEEEGLPAGTLIGGRYELVERVGVGAFGDVYRASDVEVPGHVVALKLLRTPALSESARQSALRELKLNAAVFHPSLVQFKDHGWFEQRLWFVMPWYEGETLEARMHRGPLGRAEARRVFEPLARALAALHEVGIRHQDIKPENILLTKLPGHGEDAVLPVLIDLGVAAEGHETMLGGTPLYFAPEVAQRFLAEGHVGPDVDRAADVFALALSLRNALEPDTQPEVVAGAVKSFVARRAEEPPPELEARDLRYLRPTFDRWLNAEPLERPSAHELAEELAVLTAPEERRERVGRLLRWLLPTLATVALAFSVVVYALARRAEAGEHAAREARAQAADVQADLIVADARRASLEEGNATLLARFEQSRLSRRELAEQLATSEGQVSILRGELSRTLRQRNTLRDRLTERGQALDEARAESRRLDGSLQQARRRAERAESDHTRERARADRLASDVDAADRRARAAAERADAIEAERAEVARERDAVEAELSRLRAQLRALAGALEAPAPVEPAEAPVEPVDSEPVEP